ncbi:MAG: CDP-glycerol glycerophosphotransferase family protein [Balneolales bacterium]|nr:CDP-glycerol glycerophosphotransferase family protein [Balneolales bacterium]
MRNSENTTTYPQQWLFGLLSGLIKPFLKTDPNLVVLTSFHGNAYRGNTKIVFEELVHHPHINAVWLSRNKTVVHQLVSKYGKNHAILIHTWKGIITLAKANVYLLTHGTSDFAFCWLSRKATIIQTYHGLPTKRGEYMKPGSDEEPNWLHRLILSYRFKPIHYFLSSSRLVSELFSKRFNLTPDRILEIGFPTSDRLIKVGRTQASISQFWPEAPPAKRVILYAPTYRRRTKTRWFPFEDFDKVALENFLQKNDALLVLRSHPNEKPQTELIGNRIVSGNTPDIYSLIGLTDVIVSDYSGVYLEGLLLDIPCIFLPYDKATYERGFPYDYDEVTPGPKPKSQSDFLTSLDDALNGAESFQLERKRVRDLFFKNTDGKSTERLIQFIEKLT